VVLHPQAFHSHRAAAAAARKALHRCLRALHVLHRVRH
jgi:hypothetical protein